MAHVDPLRLRTGWTAQERENLHATFCGSRGAGDRPRPPGGTA